MLNVMKHLYRFVVEPFNEVAEMLHYVQHDCSKVPKLASFLPLTDRWSRRGIAREIEVERDFLGV